MSASAAAHAALADLGRLLDLAAGLYLREPDSERLGLCGELAEELEHLPVAPDLVSLFAAAAREEPEAVRQDFFDLLLVPCSDRFCAPFEGAHRENGGESNPAVAAFYRAAGFSPVDLDLPVYLQGIARYDHIGLEMAFLAGLLLSAAEANPAERVALLTTASRFHHEHGDWLGAFGQRLEAAATTSYGRVIGLLTTGIAESLCHFFLTLFSVAPAPRAERHGLQLSP